MLAVPVSLSQVFEAQIVQRNLPNQHRRDFHKWFRVYLDFCNKYGSNPNLTASIDALDEKLQRKDQSEIQRQQAYRAVAIYSAWLVRLNRQQRLLAVRYLVSH